MKWSYKQIKPCTELIIKKKKILDTDVNFKDAIILIRFMITNLVNSLIWIYKRADNSWQCNKRYVYLQYIFFI